MWSDITVCLRGWEETTDGVGNYLFLKPPRTVIWSAPKLCKCAASVLLWAREGSKNINYVFWLMIYYDSLKANRKLEKM